MEVLETVPLFHLPPYGHTGLFICLWWAGTVPAQKNAKAVSPLHDQMKHIIEEGKKRKKKNPGNCFFKAYS